MKLTTKTLSFVMLGACSASAATISWDPVLVNTTAADIINTGTLITAQDGGSTDDTIINGVTFLGGGGATNAILPGAAEGTFWTTGTGVNTTGDAGLDSLLDSHTWQGGTPSAGSFDVNGLIAGQSYVIQIISVGDTRGCCATRTQNYGDGVGAPSGDLTRADPASVVGYFTADDTFQTIFVNGSQDGGISGFQVRGETIPEPGSALLSLVGLLGLAARRRR